MDAEPRNRLLNIISRPCLLLTQSLMVLRCHPLLLSLAMQELYQVDEFPIEMEEAERWVVVRKPKPDAKYRHGQTNTYRPSSTYCVSSTDVV